MIPKIIHYIWFGEKDLPPMVKRCIQSWEKYCPDFEIKRWDETNLDINKYKFAKDAYNAKKFAFASDVFRFDVLFNEGGIYLDVDVELLRSLDDFLNLSFFTGFEDEKFLAPGLIMGSEANNFILKDILESYKRETFDKKNLKTVCKIMTNYFKCRFKNFQDNGTTQELENKVEIFSKEYFCPKDYKTGEINITKNTYSIHHYLASWLKPSTLPQKCVFAIKQFFKIIIGKKNK